MAIFDFHNYFTNFSWESNISSSSRELWSSLSLQSIGYSLNWYYQRASHKKIKRMQAWESYSNKLTIYFIKYGTAFYID